MWNIVFKINGYLIKSSSFFFFLRKTSLLFFYKNNSFLNYIKQQKNIYFKNKLFFKIKI